jgi:hypothetical protein
MRLMLIAASILAMVAVSFGSFRAWQYSELWPEPSSEVVQLTQEKRVILGRLRSEAKFGPNDYPPLGYTGAATPADQALGTTAVNGVIDAVLAEANGPVQAKTVSDLIGKAMRKVELLETEDRDRTQGYMLEIWYILGFKGATGRFAYGAAFQKPPGFGEPLPPGWTAPDKPRPIR